MITFLFSLGGGVTKVLFVQDCYYYRGKRYDMANKVEALAPYLPTTARTVVLPYPAGRGGGGAAEGDRPGACVG